MVAQGRGSDGEEKSVYFRRKSHLIYDANSYAGGLNNLECVPPQQVVASHTIEEDFWEPSCYRTPQVDLVLSRCKVVNAYIVTGRRNLVQTGAPLQPSGARHAGSRHTGISPGSEGTVYSRLSSELYTFRSM